MILPNLRTFSPVSPCVKLSRNSIPMPLFEFQCSSCDSEFELLVAAKEKPDCPECNSKRLEKLMSASAGRVSAGASLPIAGSDCDRTTNHGVSIANQYRSGSKRHGMAAGANTPPFIQLSLLCGQRIQNAVDCSVKRIVVDHQQPSILLA